MNLVDAWTSLTGSMNANPPASLAGLVSLAQKVPTFSPARFAVVDALLTAGHVDAAAKLVTAAAIGFAKQGAPVEAIHACKLLEGMGRDSDRVASEIAMIYAGLTGSELVPTLAEVSLPEGEAPPPASGDVVAQAVALGDIELPLPERFPALPLLSRLSPEDFIVVLRAMKLHRVAKGGRVVSQGAVGHSCFLLAQGALVVSRQVAGEEKALARLFAGTIFGEMALVSRRPRNASISSLGDATLLELSKATLLTHSKAMRDALYAFARRRLLENITVTSPLFQALNRQVRLELVGMFGSFPIAVGTPLIREGEAGQGLFVVLRGSVRVSKAKDGHAVDLATLGEGALFGEISIIRDTPTTASVIGEEEGEVLFLDKGDFHAVAARYPQVQAALAALTEERLRDSERALDSVAEEDAHHLI